MGILNVKDRITEFSNRFKLTDVDTGISKTYDLEQVTGTVTEVGTPINKALFDKIEYEIETSSTYEKINLDKIENSNSYFSSTHDLNNMVDNQRKLINTPDIISEETTFSNTSDNSLYGNSALVTDTRIINVHSDTNVNNFSTKLTIRDSKNNLINEQVIYDGQSVTFCTLLANGNIFISLVTYSNGGYFIIVDQEGNIIKELTQFSSTATTKTYFTAVTGYHNSVLLNNGNVFLCYSTGSAYYFMIFDENGNVIKETTNISSTSYATSVYATKYDNGNVLVVYSQGDSYYAAYSIFDQDGNTVKAYKRMNTTKCYNTKCVIIDDDRFLMASPTNDDIVKCYLYTISNESGTQVFSKAYSGDYQTFIIKLPNGSSEMYFRISSNSGKLINKTIFNSEGVKIEENIEVTSDSSFNYFVGISSANNIIIYYNVSTSSPYGIKNYIIPYTKFSTMNYINNIPIDTILKGNSYYELIYKQDQNKFLAFERRV